MNGPAAILWASDRCPVRIDDFPSSCTHLWGFFQEPFLSWWLLKLEKHRLVCPEVHPVCLGYPPSKTSGYQYNLNMCLTAINKVTQYCFIIQHCPRPDWILRSFFHPQCLPWPFLHNRSASWPSSSALQQLPRPCVISYYFPLLEKDGYIFYSSYIKGLLMSSDALGRQAGDMAAGRPSAPKIPLPHALLLTPSQVT